MIRSVGVVLSAFAALGCISELPKQRSTGRETTKGKHCDPPSGSEKASVEVDRDADANMNLLQGSIARSTPYLGPTTDADPHSHSGSEPCNDGDAAPSTGWDGGRITESQPDGTLYSNVFFESFDTWNEAAWTCEYTCPTVSNGIASFNLRPGVTPRREGSWSKIVYRIRRFVAGSFTVRFALSERPREAVWWGVALWNTGPNPDQSEASEINFGITTSESAKDTEIRFESMKQGCSVTHTVDTGIDLYDGSFHVARLVYDATHVAFYFDGDLLDEITDADAIAAAPMYFLVGPRLVRSPALTSPFVESVDYLKVAW